MSWSLTIAEVLPARRGTLWQLAKQAGATAAVVSLPEGPDDPPVWKFETLLRLKQDFASDGIDLQVIESAPSVLMEPIKQGTDQFDWALDRFCELIDNMGRAGIPVMCHNFMAGIGWQVTDRAVLDIGYRYMDYGKAQSGKVDSAGFVNPVVRIDDMTAHEFKVGLRYHFGGGCCDAPASAPMK